MLSSGEETVSVHKKFSWLNLIHFDPKQPESEEKQHDGEFL
jgi:hypothetical protein